MVKKSQQIIPFMHKKGARSVIFNSLVVKTGAVTTNYLYICYEKQDS